MNVSALRAAVLDGVAAEIREILADADAQAAAELERARTESETLLRQAAEEGAAAGELETARAQALARRQARRRVLEARRALYDDFRRDARDAALSLREDPGYPALLARLAATTRALLGDGATIERDPEGAGGLRARAGPASVDLTLPVMADRCIAGLGDRVEGLWR
jgi:vacuolar-type H+-ATPase subunit E/Vma4